VRKSREFVRPLATLVVDDNGVYRSELIEYLRTQEGIEIVGEAEDGSGAIVMAQALNPDLVLMDISMPGVSGLEAARVIKDKHTRAKVVLVTIHEEKTYRQLADVIRADGFICKSTVTRDFPKVVGRIRSALQEC
jgi:DNA-binding NarL/FixJ family response regulator